MNAPTCKIVIRPILVSWRGSGVITKGTFMVDGLACQVKSTKNKISIISWKKIPCQVLNLGPPTLHNAALPSVLSHHIVDSFSLKIILFLIVAAQEKVWPPLQNKSKTLPWKLIGKMTPMQTIVMTVTKAIRCRWNLKYWTASSPLLRRNWSSVKVKMAKIQAQQFLSEMRGCVGK